MIQIFSDNTMIYRIEKLTELLRIELNTYLSENILLNFKNPVGNLLNIDNASTTSQDFVLIFSCLFNIKDKDIIKQKFPELIKKYFGKWLTKYEVLLYSNCLIEVVVKESKDFFSEEIQAFLNKE